MTDDANTGEDTTAQPIAAAAAQAASAEDSSPPVLDLAAFQKAKYALRTATVDVDGLVPDDPRAKVRIRVRGLNGEEFYRVREALSRRKDLSAIAGKLMSAAGGGGQAFAEALEEFYGDLPDEQVRTIEIVAAGCVEPKFASQDAIKLVKFFPTQAHLVCQEILRLTGEGAQLGESKGSGGTPASATT